MNNKNNKNTLLQSVAYGPHAAYMALRLKASFHASPAATMALLAKHRLHQSKNIALRAEKQFFSYAPVYLKENVFNVFAFGDFKARSAAMVVMMDDENSFSIRHQQQQRKS